MQEKTIVDALTEAREHSYAIGAFNILDYNSGLAVAAAAEQCGKPVILQASSGTAKFYGPETLRRMVSDIQRLVSIPVYIHLDHCRSLSLAKACADARWDSVMVDGSSMSFRENVEFTREAVLYAHAAGVYTEGELGVIEGVEEEISAEKGISATPEECFEFVEKTKIDFFAPAVGTAHGVYKRTPKINFELVEILGKQMPQPIVCHGGTGLSDDTFRRLIELGISKVNVSTALKHAYMDSTAAYLKENPTSYAPFQMIESQINGVTEMAKKHITVFSN